MRFELPCIIHCQEVLLLAVWWDHFSVNDQLHLPARHGFYIGIFSPRSCLVQVELGGEGYAC